MRLVIGSPPSDYINASWIKLPGSPLKYIATQAPLRRDTNDLAEIEMFWQMILHRKVNLKELPCIVKCLV